MENSSKHNNSLIILLFVLLLISCIIAGFFAYQTHKLAQELTEQRNLISLSPVSTSIIDQTVDWKTYIDKESQIEFKYPENLLFKDLGNGVISFSDKDDNFVFNFNGASTLNREEFENRKFNNLKEFTDELGRKWKTDIVYGEVFNYEAIIDEFSTIRLVSFQGKTAEIQKLGEQILPTIRFLKQENNPPVGWKKHSFMAQGITIYTPSDWDSDSRYFSESESTLLRFWKRSSPNIVPIQLDIKPNWDNTGNSQDLSKNYLVAGDIPATRVDPPKKTEQTLERYQTNVFFEYMGKVYYFECVHNWQDDYVNTCNTMIETMEFSK